MRIIHIYKTLIRNNFLWLERIAKWGFLWFGIGAVIFLFFPHTYDVFQEFLDELFREILDDQELATNIESMWLIFKNNATAALITLFLGIIFGLAPLGGIALNFFILGFLYAVFSFSDRIASFPEGMIWFILAIAPHGIVELPAFLLAGAFGLRFGFFWKIHSDKSIWKKFMQAFKENILITVLVLMMLLVASFLEIFVTGTIIEALLA